ncbi:MAG: peptidylprolyl isomerase [Gammaproteobacteria bacterium]|nr:peptidylprolyl isomerase [Gammaproteobacteria bacterium]MCF6229296.1 peptidylprolyl isomerase [Gammaproteobacteria bacterium]
MIKINTNKGSFTLELDAEKAPKTVENFIQYAKDGFYDGTIFHRVIKGFMVQGGGMEPGMQQKKTNATIENEADNGLTNEVGTVAMARTPDPHSASSQFFINVANNSFLNFSSATAEGYGYCVFGKIVDGMEIISEIEGVETGTVSGHQNVPVDDIIIESIDIIESAA